MYGAFDNHFHNCGERNQAFLDYLIIFGFGLPSVKAGGEIDGHGFSDEARAGIEFENSAPVVGTKPSLFNQFALGGCQFLLAGIDAARGEFPQIVVRGMAILALEEHTRRRSRPIDGQYSDRTRMMNEISAHL